MIRVVLIRRIGRSIFLHIKGLLYDAFGLEDDGVFYHAAKLGDFAGVTEVFGKYDHCIVMLLVDKVENSGVGINIP